MLIFHIADLQLGFSTFDGTFSPVREQDFRNVWHAAVLEALERKADLVAIAGDIFEYDGSRRNPITPAAYVAFREGLQTLNDHGVDTVAVSGNHDTPRVSTREHPLAVFEGLFPRVHVQYSGPEVIEIGDLDVCLIPWIHQQPLTGDDFQEADLCVLHAPSAVVDPNYGDHVRAFEEEYAERYKYVALGDWHGVRKVANNAWYSGALERTSFAQAKELTGGFFVTIDESGVVSREHWSSPARQMSEVVIGDDVNRRLRDLIDRDLDDQYGSPMLRIVFDGIDPTTVDPELLGRIHDEIEFVKESWKNPSPSKKTEELKHVAVSDQWQQYCDDSELEDDIKGAGLEALEEVRAV